MKTRAGFIRIHLLTALIWMVLAGIALGLNLTPTKSAYYTFSLSEVNDCYPGPTGGEIETVYHEHTQWGAWSTLASVSTERSYVIPVDANLPVEAFKDFLSLDRDYYGRWCKSMRYTPDYLEQHYPHLYKLSKTSNPVFISDSGLNWSDNTISSFCLFGIAMILIAIVSEALIRSRISPQESSATATYSDS
jgi:hypothetical protein